MASEKAAAMTDPEPSDAGGRSDKSGSVLILCLTFLFLLFPARLYHLPAFPVDRSITFPMPPVPGSPLTSDRLMTHVSFWEAAAYRERDRRRNRLFPFPDDLKPQVDFWKEIFTRYTTRQAVLHDDWYLGIVYGVVDLDRSVVDGKTGWKAVAAAKDRLRELLKGMAEKWETPETMSEEEKAVFALFRGQPESPRFPKRTAYRRVRAQVGQADRVRRGIGYSGRYMDTFRKIFAEKGLPQELVCLPLIESGFNPMARSHAGAAGMWQFMPATGRQFGLAVGELVDERLDPLRAAEAAAGLLAFNYRVIGSWPLAITAYNHGLRGMQNAVRAVGTDRIETIVRDYDGPRFSFSSRNFYVEFLAAVDVFTRYQTYFGDIDWHPPLETRWVTLEHHVSAPTLARYCGLDIDAIRRLNPALSPKIFEDRFPIPRSYRLNLPPEAGDRFDDAYARIPDELKLTHGPGHKTETIHRVRKNQTLSHIAMRYGTSVRTLMRVNGIRRPDRIRVGQKLKIPGKAGRAVPKKTARTGGTRHRVRRGQTLSAIAQLYDLSPRAIAQANAIRNPSRIMAGQLLKIPEG